MPTHNLADCPHNPTFDSIAATLTRLDKHTERTATALEDLVRVSVTIQNHEVRIDKNTKDIGAAWKVLREIELRHAEEHGAAVVEEKIEERQQKFWDGVKQQFTEKAIMGMFFAWWLGDKFHIPTRLLNWIKEFKG